VLSLQFVAAYVLAPHGVLAQWRGARRIEPPVAAGAVAAD
jgi:hypothetical protein